MPIKQAVTVSLVSASILVQAGCSGPAGSSHPEAAGAQSSVSAKLVHPSASVPGDIARPRGRRYPRHTGIIATTFWVGEIFDPSSPNGSQVISTYDAHWMPHYGGCDGVMTDGGCQTQRRVAANGYFPTRMTPRENPFYLDLPFDDVNNAAAFSQRALPPVGEPPRLRRARARPGVQLHEEPLGEADAGREELLRPDRRRGSRSLRRLPVCLRAATTDVPPAGFTTERAWTSRRR